MDSAFMISGPFICVIVLVHPHQHENIAGVRLGNYAAIVLPYSNRAKLRIGRIIDLFIIDARALRVMPKLGHEFLNPLLFSPRGRCKAAQKIVRKGDPGFHIAHAPASSNIFLIDSRLSAERSRKTVQPSSPSLLSKWTESSTRMPTFRSAQANSRLPTISPFASLMSTPTSGTGSPASLQVRTSSPNLHSSVSSFQSAWS